MKRNKEKEKKRYEKPKMKKVYSPEHDRDQAFNVLPTSCSCGGCGCA